ncbi:MAG: PEGA domain-containing protein [Planctomycetes bacterium]|nr:PEGA domain-containing protein [Planctomycetota bacterium]
MRFVLMLCLVILFATSCNRGVVWQNDVPGSDVNKIAESTERIIVAAPAQIDEFVKKYPSGREAFAWQVVNHLQGFVENTKFYYGAQLPPSNDAQWNTGAVSATQGAHLVVLCELMELKTVKVPGTSRNDSMLESRVQIRVLDKQGKELWRKQHSARVKNNNSPKFRNGANSTESRATWDANRQCLSALRRWLDVQSDKEMFDGKKALIAAPTTAKLTLDSIPSGADVLIGGKLKGTTPCVLEVGLQEVMVSIELSGYNAWQRTFEIEEDMVLKPTLQPTLQPAQQSTQQPAEPTGQAE